MSEREPTGWLESVIILGSDDPVRVTLEERNGGRILLRQVDPCEPTPPRVPLYEGDEVIVMTAFSHIGVHSTPEVGNLSDLIHAMRIVPVRREGTTVYARSLRLGETDDGRRVHVRPGESIAFEGGAVVAELDAIDAREHPTESGYVPLTSVLSAWFHIGIAHWDGGVVRYALAAARRLDMANELLVQVAAIEKQLNASNNLPGPQLRRALFTLIGDVELAVISLGRALTMIIEAPTKFGIPHTIPTAITLLWPKVNAIRNAYEHIEDRAFGTVRGHASGEALGIFDYERLLREDVIAYAGHTLNIASEVPQLLLGARAELKAMLSDSIPDQLGLVGKC